MSESEEAEVWPDLHQSHQRHQPLTPHPTLNVPKPRTLTYGAGEELPRAGPLPHLSAPIWVLALGAQGRELSGLVFQPCWLSPWKV